MSLRHVEKDLNSRGLKGLAKAVAGIRQDFSDRTGEKDIPFPEPMKKSQRASEVESQTPNPLDLLRQAAQELNKNPFNPEAVTNFQQAFWQVPRGKEGLTFDIGVCNATEEKLAKPIINVEGKKIPPFTFGVPSELKGKKGLIMLGRMFPEINSYSVAEDTPIEDESEYTGYLKVEGVIDSPNLNTDEEQVRQHFASQGISGQRLITYLIVSRQMKIIKGQYPDQGSTWSRLFGSRRGGRAVYARCHPGGCVVVFRFLFPQDRLAHLGARSEEVL